MTRQAAIKWYTRHLSAAADKGPEYYREAKRWLILNDLFYMLVAGLGRKDGNRDWLFDRCREVQAAPDGHLDLWSREHYKSTIITFAKTVQDILADPERTFGIFSHTRPIAKGFLRQIKREFEGNETLRSLFDDVLWGNVKDAPKWSEDDGIIVKRKGNPKESTVEAWGLVDGQPTSKHFWALVYDDVVTRESVTSPEMMKKVTEAWELSLNLGSAGGVRRMIGTRYHYNDTYKTVIDRGAASPRIYPATADGKIDGPPVLLSREHLAQKRRDYGPYTFACQMMMDPKADETQGFKEDWLCIWPAQHTKNLNLYVIVDPASGKKKTEGDYTAMWCVGLGADDNYYVVDICRSRLNPTQRIDRVFDWHRKYQPVAVGYEDYGMQADLHFLRERMKEENYRFKVLPLGGSMAKEDRIRRLIPLFENGRIILPETCWRVNHEGEMEDLTQVFIEQEYMSFPVAPHDDMLDALARIADPDFPMRPPRDRRSQADATTEYDLHRW